MRLIIESDNIQPYMTNFRICRNHFDYTQPRTMSYIVITDSSRFGEDAVVYESTSLEKCVEWIKSVCEFYMETFKDIDFKKWQAAKSTIANFSKRTIPIQTAYNADDFNAAEFNKTTDVINKAIKKITNLLYIDLTPDMFSIESDDDMAAYHSYRNSNQHGASGNYDITSHKICINSTILKSEHWLDEVVIHEIGHYIHHRYFGFKQINWSKQDRTKYSLSNNKEAFAEIFVAFINNPDSTSLNVIKMKDLLNSLHLLK